MATRKATKKIEAPATVETVNKSDAIRTWFDANPEGTAVQCVKALAEQGIEVGSAHCQQILTKRRGGGTSAKVDVAAIKLAAEFVATHEDIEAAIESINAVGDFIKQCGSPAKAIAALESYQAVAAALA